MIDKLVTDEIYEWKEKEHKFHLGQPLWVHGDPTTWIAIGFFKAMWSEWWCAAVPEDKLDAQPSNIPCSWLSDRMPGEPVYSNVIHVNFRKQNG